MVYFVIKMDGKRLRKIEEKIDFEIGRQVYEIL